MDWQTGIALLIVAAAGTYVVRGIIRTWRGKAAGCGCGAGECPSQRGEAEKR